MAANRAVALLTAGSRPELLEPPVNVLRVSLHPDGMAPRIVNLGEWRAHLLERLERQIALTGDAALATPARGARGLPRRRSTRATGERDRRAAAAAQRRRASCAFICTVATFGTAVEVTASELAIESFFPADEATAEAVGEFVALLPPT